MKRIAVVLLLLLPLVLPPAAQTPVFIRIGVVGDSASDEYRGTDNRGGAFASVTFNWVEQLRDAGIVRVGAWSSWGEPRRTGNEYNWARSGAVSYTHPPSPRD